MQAVPVYDLEYTKVTTSPKEKSVKEFINSLTFVGSGTKEDPYVCEGQTLNLDSYDLVKIIEDTDDYYIIRNCRFIAEKYATVWIYNVENCLVENCEFTGCQLTIHSSLNCSARNSTFRQVRHYDSAGVTVWGSTNCTVVDNVVNDCGAGIQVNKSNGTIISSNLIRDNQYDGILLAYSNRTTLQSNYLYNNSLNIKTDYWRTPAGKYLKYEYVENTINCSGNFVNEKPLVILQDMTNEIIDASNYGQLILQNCSGVTVSNGKMNQLSYGLQLLSSWNVSFKDISVANYTQVGFKIENCNASSLYNCSFMYGDRLGIEVTHSWNITVEDCYLADNEGGVHLSVSANCTIRDSLAERNEAGISFYSTGNSTVINNTLIENYIGINFAGHSEHNVVVNNTIIFNTYCGIYLHMHTRSNRFYGNAIGWNGRHNAFDDGHNYFDDGVRLGNLWSDYDGSGIYDIDIFSEDNFPSILYPEARLLDIQSVFSSAALIAIFAIGFIRMLKRRRNLQT